MPIRAGNTPDCVDDVPLASVFFKIVRNDIFLCLYFDYDSTNMMIMLCNQSSLLHLSFVACNLFHIYTYAAGTYT